MRERGLQVGAVSAHEGELVRGDGALLHLLVQRAEHLHRRLDPVLLVIKVPAIGLLERLVPLLRPEDGDADELVGDEERLLDERVVLLPHLLQDALRPTTSRGGGCAAVAPVARLVRRHRERVDERLWVTIANAEEERVDRLAHPQLWR